VVFSSSDDYSDEKYDHDVDDDDGDDDDDYRSNTDIRAVKLMLHVLEAHFITSGAFLNFLIHSRNPTI
jgi:hypothetical protein